MKILEFRAENIKNLKVVEIKPENTTVVLTGKNGAGKSAVLDAIFLALTGKKIEQPIRNGEKRAEVSIDLGTYKVKRIYTEKNERLEVTNSEGAAYPSPQTLLNKILGKLSFDPLAFSRLEPEKQRKVICTTFGIDLTAIQGVKDGLYQDRTLLNRETKALEAQINALPIADVPEKEISLSDGIDEVKTLREKRNVFLALQDRKKLVEKRIDDNSTLILEHKQKIAALIAEIKTNEMSVEGIETANTDLRKELQKCNECIRGTTEVTEEKITQAEASLKDIETKNVSIREQQKRRSLQQKHKEFVAKADNCTKEISKCEQEKLNRIKSCKFPLEGLTINDEAVIYEGKPFSQLSTGEQIKVSTAIAMAVNPKLRIILIREGSLLDKEGMSSIIQVARDKDYQLWIEKVDESKGVGVHIEDGQIVNE